MARRFGSWQFLTDDECRSEAFGVAKIIRSLVGRAAYLYELASGLPAGDTHVTPQNPQGQHGLDLSGPPWGSAIRHPIAWMIGKKPSTSTAYGQPCVIGVSSAAPAVLGPWSIWVRPFERLPAGSIAPYSLGQLRMRAHNSGAGTSNIDIAIENLTMQDLHEHPDTGTYGSTGSYASTSEGSFTWDASPYTGNNDPALIPLVPGWNDLLLTFTSDSTNTTYIEGLVINQIQKRSH